jgi:AbiV family abortive infection protein
MTLSLSQIDEGMEALCANAAELIAEAKVLHEGRSYARAFALAHLAREELSKSAMLYAAGVRIIAKHKVNWKRLMQRLRDHKAKLRLEVAGMAMMMKATGNDEVATAILNGAASAIVEHRNDNKNAALYVGFVDGTFVMPRDTRSEHQSWRTIELAKMKLTETDFIRKKTGPFSVRAIGSFEMPNYDDPDIARASLEVAAAMHLLISEMAHETAEDAGPKGPTTN